MIRSITRGCTRRTGATLTLICRCIPLARIPPPYAGARNDCRANPPDSQDPPRHCPQVGEVRARASKVAARILIGSSFLVELGRSASGQGGSWQAYGR